MNCIFNCLTYLFLWQFYLIQELELRINYKCLPANELDFIMDELSIVQFYQRNGKGTAKLVIIDFYKELDSCYEKIPCRLTGAVRCSSCNQGGELKKCSRCHSVSYCSVTCQRSDWHHHKLNCTKWTDLSATYQTNSFLYHLFVVVTIGIIL